MRSIMPQTGNNEGRMRMRKRKAVNWFSTVMELTLQRKDPQYPNGWESDSLELLTTRLLEEVGELKEALSHHSGPDTPPGQRHNIIAEASDVANLAMMIADKQRNHPFNK